MTHTTVRRSIENAFSFVKHRGIAGKGDCVEASVNMYHYLSSRGIETRIVRYELPEGGGHWTIETPIGEFDPTISMWENPPSDAVKGELYQVTLCSPHRVWKREYIPECKAYLMVYIDPE